MRFGFTSSPFLAVNRIESFSHLRNFKRYCPALSFPSALHPYISTPKKTPQKQADSFSSIRCSASVFSRLSFSVSLPLTLNHIPIDDSEKKIVAANCFHPSLATFHSGVFVKFHLFFVYCYFCQFWRSFLCLFQQIRHGGTSVSRGHRIHPQP